MDKQRMLDERKPGRQQQTRRTDQTTEETTHAQGGASGMAELHRHIGNQAVQRLLAQRSANDATELDEPVAGHIERARGGGRPLDASVGAQMSQAMGVDVSGVNVHTSPEADTLNRQLGAKAFTTGQDIFFREGTYDPHSTEGQELIAHELTHVVQQGTGAVQSGSRMTVGAPGDVHEQQADATARAVTNAGVQRQEEEELVQMQTFEEDEIQMQTFEEDEIQMQEMPEEEELVQTQEMPEEEELIQQQSEEEEEEEELQP